MSDMVTFLKTAADQYCDPKRYYHTLEHIQQMFRDAQMFCPEPLSDVQVMAIWGHDIVYIPGYANNEADSADMTIKTLKGELSQSQLDAVAAIIIATKTHLPPFPEAAKVVVDLDLLGLGFPPPVYRRATRRIWEEVKAHGDNPVGLSEFVEGRIKFLDAYGSRDHLFHTPWGRRFESRAKLNMKTEEQWLRYDPSDYLESIGIMDPLV